MPVDPSSITETQLTWTIGRLLDWTTRWFQEKQVEGGRLSAELLLSHALGCKKIELYTRYAQEPTEDQRTTFRDLVKRAGQHTPIAYLLGSREFFSLRFEVTPAVLIPRPETEALVQRAVDICRADKERAWQILDIGTGSGCIAVALAQYAPNAHILAGDLSAEAIAVAQRNVDAHKLSDRIKFVVADGARIAADDVPTDGFDLVVTNPPYISEQDWRTLPPHIRDHEPRLALTCDGDDGLGMYRRLAAEAHQVLKPSGLLLAEIGAGQLAAVRSAFETAGWRFLGSHRDSCDPHERVVEFLRP